MTTIMVLISYVHELYDACAGQPAETDDEFLVLSEL